MSNSHLFLKSGFPRAPLANGIGRYVCQLQRITLKFCKSHGSSRGVREFIENDLVTFATAHPGIVVYVKPRRHRSPILKAEYCKYVAVSVEAFIPRENSFNSIPVEPLNKRNQLISGYQDMRAPNYLPGSTSLTPAVENTLDYGWLLQWMEKRSGSTWGI